MTTFGRILVGTDFSDCSRAALCQAAGIGRTVGAEIHVAHVIDTLGENPLVEAYRAAIDDQLLIDGLLKESNRLMDLFIQGSECGDLDVRRVQVRGPKPARALIAYATEHEMDLIAVGTHGRTGIRRLFLGSVAKALVAEADIPVLVAREQSVADRGGHLVKRILVPLDLSENSVAGLEAAHRLASVHHAKLEILHVLERFAVPVSLKEIRTLRDLVPDVEDRIYQMIMDLVQKLEGPYIPYKSHVREGMPAATILDYASEVGCDLIVMAKRGLSASERFLLGSVTEKVLLGASCSVYVEPAPKRIAGRRGTSPEESAHVDVQPLE